MLLTSRYPPLLTVQCILVARGSSQRLVFIKHPLGVSVAEGTIHHTIKPPSGIWPRRRLYVALGVRTLISQIVCHVIQCAKCDTHRLQLPSTRATDIPGRLRHIKYSGSSFSESDVKLPYWVNRCQSALDTTGICAVAVKHWWVIPYGNSV